MNKLSFGAVVGGWVKSAGAGGEGGVKVMRCNVTFILEKNNLQNASRREV